MLLEAWKEFEVRFFRDIVVSLIFATGIVMDF